MKIETFKINWESLGAKLANLSTDEQIPFFRGFCDEMLKYESHYNMEMQLTHIREGMKDEALTVEQRDIFQILGYIKEEV